jgi:DNA polymerase-4
MLHHPRLRGHPVAVGGSVEARHGIILAKNYEAKAYGIQVGQALWQAREKCPGLIVVPPDYEKYLKFSRMFRDILADYSDDVEPFGLDESWVDVSPIAQKAGESQKIADEIRERVKLELGVTVSVGVSFNKIFAKLGSDIKKPDATTVITEENYRDVVWRLPAEDLLGVGRATKIGFAQHGIKTIGDIANADCKAIQRWFGKWGLYLYYYANGLDTSPVKASDYESAVKSVGNSTTCPRDLQTDEDAHIVLLNLAESVAERMRDLGLAAKTVVLSLRTTDLRWCERQMALQRPSMIATELTAAALELLRKHHKWHKPLRSIGIRGANLVPVDDTVQLSLLEDDDQRQRNERLEYAIDGIRRRFGHRSINHALLCTGGNLGQIDPKAENIIHPIGYS